MLYFIFMPYFIFMLYFILLYFILSDYVNTIMFFAFRKNLNMKHLTKNIMDNYKNNSFFDKIILL